MDEIDTAYGIGVCGETAHDACAADIPEEYCFVVAAAYEHVAFGGEGDGVDVVVVAYEGDGMGFALDDAGCQLSSKT